MAKLPFFKFFANEWITDEIIRLMSREAKGLYIDILAHCWIEGSFPTDPGQAAKIFGEKKNKFSKLFSEFSVKFYEKKGRYFNKRLEEERAKADNRSAVNSKNGLEGAKARWQTDGDGIANAIDSPWPGNSIKESESESESESETDSSACVSFNNLGQTVDKSKIDQGQVVEILSLYSTEIKQVALSSANLWPVRQAMEDGLTQFELRKAIYRALGAYGASGTDKRYRKGPKGFFDSEYIRFILSDKFELEPKMTPDKKQTDAQKWLADQMETTK